MTEQTDGLPRRIVFQGLGALGTAVALAACSGGDDDGEDAPAPGAGAELAATADVPVGGGVILAEQRIVLTQPTQGEFKAFSAICTHQRCEVTEVDETINCPCHHSRFSLEDGSPQSGPAPEPLETVAIEVRGDMIVAT